MAQMGRNIILLLRTGKEVEIKNLSDQQIETIQNAL